MHYGSNKEAEGISEKTGGTQEGKEMPRGDCDTPDRSPSPNQKETMVQRVKSVCSIERKLVFYKLFYLTFCGAIGCVLPYVAVFLKQEGMGPEKIGIISGVRPIIGFISAPLLGMCGDSCGRRKIILLISIVAWLAIYVALYHVPAPARITSCPASLVPHRLRHVRHQRRLLAAESDPDNPLAAPELPAATQELLQENLEWLYIKRHLYVIFIVTFCLIVGGEVFQSPTTALSDAGTLQTLGIDRLDDYGAQRAWGSIGWGLSSFLAGALVSSSRKKEVLCGVELYFSDYRLLTYVFIGFIVVSFIAATQIKFKEGDDEETVELTSDKEKKAKSQDTSDVSKKKHDAGAVVRIFFNLHYGSWLATSFFVGICNGVIWGFLYWHLDNLGASQLLMGVSGIVVCFSEFVMFFLVGKVIKLLGHIGVMYLGLLGYTVRFCIYAVIRNPWWVLPAEVLQGITFSIVWVSMTAYTTMAVPTASLATIQGILHGVYFGLGSGSGHLIGGIMIGYVGAVITFFSFAGSTVFVLLLFVVAQKCSTKPPDVYGYKDLDEETDKSNVSSERGQETSLQTEKTKLDD